MTEREYHPDHHEATTPAQRGAYRDQSVDELDDRRSETRRVVSRERVAGPDGAYEVRREHVLPSESARRAAAARRAQQVIGFIVGVIVVLLAIRFVLLLLGASQASGFVQLIYSLTQPLTAPFQGIFGEPTLGAAVVEWASLVAMICYSLIGYGLSRLVEIVGRPARPADGEPL